MRILGCIPSIGILKQSQSRQGRSLVQFPRDLLGSCFAVIDGRGGSENGGPVRKHREGDILSFTVGNQI
jgi:hypothetical protein